MECRLRRETRKGHHMCCRLRHNIGSSEQDTTLTQSLTTYIAIESAKSSLPPSIPLVKGIMSIRKITFDGVSRTMHGRELSCFDFSVDIKCSHNHHLIDLSDWDGATGIQLSNKKSHECKYFITESAIIFAG